MKKSKKLMIMGLSAATAAVAATGAVSSFAWFAINDQVSATGMVIKADAGQYLEIRRVDGTTSVSTTWAKEAAALTGIKTIKPVSIGAISTSSGGTTNDTFTAGTTWSGHQWATTSSDNVDVAEKGTSAVYENVTAATDVVSYDTTNYANNVYALVEEFDIRVRYLGDTNTAYKLSATVDWASSVPGDASNKTNDTGTTKTNYYLHNAARVYFVVGALETASSSITYATPIAASDTGTLLASNKSISSSTESDVDVGTSGDWTNTKTPLVSSMKAMKNDSTATGGDHLGNGVRVRVYFYFDGTDANCFSSAVLGNEYSINVKFDVEKAASSSSQDSSSSEGN